MTNIAKRAKPRKRPSYDDKFRATAVVMLKSQGYPDIKGALTMVANHLKVPARTLSRWFNGEQNPPPDQEVNEKTFDMRTAIDAELRAIVKDMPVARADANYRELGSVFGILFDKLRLLEGLPTEIVSVLPELLMELEKGGARPSDVFHKMLERAKAANAQR